MYVSGLWKNRANLEETQAHRENMETHRWPGPRVPAPIPGPGPQPRRSALTTGPGPGAVMGSSSSSSSSSLLDENQRKHILERGEAELQDFLPFYKKQFFASRFNEVENRLEPKIKAQALWLQRKPRPPGSLVQYEAPVQVLDWSVPRSRSWSWQSRYVVLRGLRLEIHGSLQDFLRGSVPLQVLLPAGGIVFTSTESYLDRLRTDSPSLDPNPEDLSSWSGSSRVQFPIFLLLPHRRDAAFGFKTENQREQFCSILEDCIRHQNHDFRRGQGPEGAEPLLRAVRLWAEKSGRYQTGSLLIGSDIRILSSAVLNRFLPELQVRLLESMKNQKNLWMWNMVLEEVHVLLDSLLVTRFSEVKGQLEGEARLLEPSMTSDLQEVLQIRHSTRHRVEACVLASAEQLVSEVVTPRLSSMLTALMEPLAEAFLCGRVVTADVLDGACLIAQEGGATAKKLVASTVLANLESCYQTLGGVSDKLAPLAAQFGFPTAAMLMLIDDARLYLQQLVDDAHFTFQQLLLATNANSDDIVDPHSAHKAKGRILQHYDYDSSVLRKLIASRTVVSIALPVLKERLDCRYATELTQLESDSTPFVIVDNEFDDVIAEMLARHVAKVLAEPENLDRFQLLPDPKPGPQPAVGPQPGPEPAVGPQPGPEPAVGPQPGPEPAVGPQPGPEPAVGPQPGPEPAVGPQPGPKPAVRPQPEPEPAVEPQPEPEPDPDANANLAVAISELVVLASLPGVQLD